MIAQATNSKARKVLFKNGGSSLDITQKIVVHSFWLYLNFNLPFCIPSQEAEETRKNGPQNKSLMHHNQQLLALSFSYFIFNLVLCSLLSFSNHTEVGFSWASLISHVAYTLPPQSLCPSRIPPLSPFPPMIFHISLLHCSCQLNYLILVPIENSY